MYRQEEIASPAWIIFSPYIQQKFFTSKHTYRYWEASIMSLSYLETWKISATRLIQSRVPAYIAAWKQPLTALMLRTVIGQHVFKKILSPWYRLSVHSCWERQSKNKAAYIEACKAQLSVYSRCSSQTYSYSSMKAAAELHLRRQNFLIPGSNIMNFDKPLTTKRKFRL